jgi:hypothetical protein
MSTKEKDFIQIKISKVTLLFPEQIEDILYVYLYKTRISKA